MKDLRDLKDLTIHDAGTLSDKYRCGTTCRHCCFLLAIWEILRLKSVAVDTIHVRIVQMQTFSKRPVVQFSIF